MSDIHTTLLNRVKPGLRRYMMTVEYRGDCFFGWQRQVMTPTVQAELEDALAIILGEKFRALPHALFGERVLVQGSGRTDTGVHALCQVAHFDGPADLHCDHVLMGINYFLKGKGAVVTGLTLAADDFHARFSAMERSYRYVILNRLAPSVLASPMAWHITRPLDADNMHAAAQLLIGHHDFSAFRDNQCQANNPTRTLRAFNVVRHGEQIHIYLSSRAFLHHQVRIMVGTLKWFGVDSKKDPRDILGILETRNRARAGQTAPAHGLFFLGTKYATQYATCVPTVATVIP